MKGKMPYGMWKENPGNVIVEWSGGFYCAWMTGERKHGLYKVIYYPENEYEYVHKHRVNPKEFMNVVDEAEEYNHVQFMEEFGAMDHTLFLERLMMAGHKTEQEKHRHLQSRIKYGQCLRQKTVLRPHSEKDGKVKHDEKEQKKKVEEPQMEKAEKKKKKKIMKKIRKNIHQILRQMMKDDVNPGMSR